MNRYLKLYTVKLFVSFRLLKLSKIPTDVIKIILSYVPLVASTISFECSEEYCPSTWCVLVSRRCMPSSSIPPTFDLFKQLIGFVYRITI